MPFLLRAPQRFIIVDEKTRQGIFYQVYNKEGFLRPSLIHSGSCLSYSATLDSHNDLHVIVQNANHQTTYYHALETSPTKRIILEDSRSLYQFENMSIQMLGDKGHLFYTVVHPNGHSRSLVHQTLDSRTPDATHLITNLPLNCQISYYLIENTLYILYPSYEEGYKLNCLTFTENAYEARTLIHSEIPIIDWNVCLHDKKLYVLYTTDSYGHLTFHLLDTVSLRNFTIPLPPNATSPALLSYLNCLWIHYKAGGKLYTLFGIPNQEMFSIPVVSSLQSPAQLYQYYSLDHNSFSASSLYANLMSHIRLATLSSIDVRDIHPDLPANLELALLLEGLSLLNSPSTPTPADLPIQPTRATQPTQPTDPPPMAWPQAPEPTAPAPLPSTKSILQATKAFMDEGNHF